MADGTIIIDTELDQSGFEKGLGKLGSIAGTGLKATTAAIAAVSGALSACAAYCTKVGSEFETSMAKVSTLADASAVPLGELQDGLQQISSSVGLSAASLSEAMYQALSASVATGDALQFVELSSKLAIGGFTDTETAVDALSSVVNAYGSELLSAEDAAKILMQTQNKGKTTVGELAASLSQCVPTAAAFNVSFEQVGASLATMTAQGTKTAQATTMLNSLCAELGKSGTTAAKSLQAAAEGTKYAGMSFSEIMASGASLIDVLMLISDEASESELSMVDMFSSIEAGKAALQLVNAEGEMFRSSLEAMSTETDVVEGAFQTMTDTFEAQANKLKVSAENLGVSVYEKLQVPLKDLAIEGQRCIQQLATAFNEGSFSGLVGEIGSSLADATTQIALYTPKIIEAAVNVIDSFVLGIKGAVPTLAPAAVEIGTALVNGILTILPELLSVGMQIILSVAEGVLESLPEIAVHGITIVSTLFNAIMEGLPQLAELGINFITTITQGIQSGLPQLIPQAMEAMVSFSGSLRENVGMLVDAGLGMIQALARSLIDNIPVFIATVPTIITNLCGCINDNAPKLLEVGIGLLLELGAGLIKAIPDLIADIPKIIEAIIAVFSAFNWLEFGSKIIKLIGDGFKAMASHLPDLMKQIGTSAKNFFSSIDWAGLGSNVITWIANGIKALLTAIPKLLLDIGKSALNGIKGMDWAGLGKNLIAGMASGIASAAAGLVNAAVSAARNAINAVKSWLGIRSPSRRAKNEVGKWILPGVGEGIKESEPELNENMEEAADKMMTSFDNRVNDVDISRLVSKMKAGVEIEAGRVSAGVTAHVTNAYNREESTSVENLDYDRLGEAVARGLILANLKFECDDRELGRLISGILPL